MAKPAPSSTTGHYLLCPASGKLHGPWPCEIKRGPKGWAFIRCPVCSTKVFLAREWRDEHGMSPEEVTGLGLRPA